VVFDSVWNRILIISYSMAKAGRYTTTKGESGGSSFATLNQKLEDDLMQSCRAVGSAELFSEKWFELSQHYTRLAHVSDVESQLAPAKNGTLWESEESALRSLVEGGKINVLLNEMATFKEEQSKTSGFQNLTASQQKCCEDYESGLGALLRNAWNHTEVLQTTDYGLLIKYVCDVLQRAATSEIKLSKLKTCEESKVDSEDQMKTLHLKQEVLSLSYLRQALINLDDLAEERFLPFARKMMLLPNALKVLCSIHTFLPRSVLLDSIHSLSLLVDTEDFSTYSEEYWGPAIDMTLLESVKNDILQPLLDDFDVRKLVRPLSTAVDKIRRQNRK
jgi:hypothetical protein